MYSSLHTGLSAPKACLIDEYALYDAGLLLYSTDCCLLLVLYNVTSANQDVASAGLLDDLMAHAFPAKSATAGSTQQPESAPSAAATCQGILQGLSSQWPALPALLFQGAVQRLKQPQCTPGQAENMSNWMQLLLASPQHSTQQPIKEKPRGTKRKSMTAERGLSSSLQNQSCFPTAAQLKHCTQTLLQGLAQADGAVATAVQQGLSVLMAELEASHAAECMQWGGVAKRLLQLAQPGNAGAAASSQGEESSQSGSLPMNVAGAAQEQQKLLQSLHIRAAPGNTSRQVHFGLHHS